MSLKISKTKTKQARFFIVLFFLILGLGMALPQPAQALTWLGPNIANSLVSIVISSCIYISGIVLGIGSWLLDWVTGPSFIKVPFTNNTFVTPAWALVRDFANMGFVIGLVAIGLGTALGRGEYKVQKTLPMLIVMALAVNFTPVFCGVLIDISNMIMEFFLQGVSLDWVVRTLRSMTISIASSVSEQDFLQILGMAIGMVAFNLVAGMVFLTFALIFATRYVALWILVILSPLAFFSYVLPATRNVWKKWWEQFTQWCFVGVIAGFWIYLSYQIMVVSGEIGSKPPPDPEFTGLSAVLSYMIPVIFLTFGLAASVTGAPKGAEHAIKIAGWARGKAAPWTREKVKETIQGIPQVQSGEEKIRRRLETMPVVGRLTGGPGTFERQRAATISSVRKELENISDTTEGNKAIRARIAQRPLTKPGQLQRIAGLEVLAKRGALEDDDRRYLRRMEQMGGDIGAVLKQRPDFADEITPPAPAPLPAGATPAQVAAHAVATTAHLDPVGHAVRRIRVNKAREINADSLRSENVVRALDERQIEDIGRNGSNEQQVNILNEIRRITGAPPGVPLNPVGALLPGMPIPSVAGISGHIINYIAAQQAANRWPV